MRTEPTHLPGCLRIYSKCAADARGSFIKTFHADSFAAAGLRTDWRESYVSCSRRGVIRGMHFQTPPADHAKVVSCVEGEVLDVVLDLRRGSPTYRESRSFHLSAENGDGIYIPSGCAHGFLGLSELSRLLYQVTSVHAADQDCGIAWDSFGFDWGLEGPILSGRDEAHPRLDEFDPPFVFDANAPSR